MLSIATWNLKRPRRASARIPCFLDRLRDRKAHLWVLTETNDAVDLRSTHPWTVSSTPVAALHTPGERWVTIWSLYPVRPIPTYDPTVAVCAQIDAPGGPLVLYATVLPHHADRGPSGNARNWAEHNRVVALQGADWRSIRARTPAHRFCVAGDLNQSRDNHRWSGRLWYGTRRGRARLTDELRTADLVCVTEGDLVGAGQLTTRSTIDHICLDTGSADLVHAVHAWEPGQCADQPLSDHNGVAVDINLPLD